MSFKDEVLRDVKFRQDMQNERFAKDIEDAPQWAKSHCQFLKDAILKEVQKNGIKLIDGKKVVEAQYFLHNFPIVEQKLSDPGLDLCYPKRHLIKCKIINELAFKRYMDALNRISTEDEIVISFCWHYMENGKDYYFFVRNKDDINNINLVSRVTYEVDFVLKGKLVFT